MSQLIFEHVATGQVLASINDEGSLVDQDATKICLVDRVQASTGNLKNLIKKEKVRVCEERSEELRRTVYSISTSNTNTSVRNIAAANTLPFSCSSLRQIQKECYFTVAPRFKSRVSGRVYDGDLVRVNGATSGGRLHFSGSHSVIDNLAKVKVREANLSLFHKVMETQVQVRTELQKKAAHRKDSHVSIQGDSERGAK